jgi:hypothetical protein
MTDALLPIAYPIEDVPAIVGVPRTKIFQAIREHKLTARKVGRSTIVVRDDLVACQFAAHQRQTIRYRRFGSGLKTRRGMMTITVDTPDGSSFDFPGSPLAQSIPLPPFPQLGLSPLRRALVNAALSLGGGMSNQQFREVPLGGEI